MAETPSSSAEGRGLILGWGAKIPHAVRRIVQGSHNGGLDQSI